jgi:hypothetical protein
VGRSAGIRVQAEKSERNGNATPRQPRHWTLGRPCPLMTQSGHFHTTVPNTLEAGANSLTGLPGLSLRFEHPLGALLVTGLSAAQIWRVHVLKLVGGHTGR